MSQTNAPPEATPETTSKAPTTTGFELSEDWVATFIGLIIVLVIGMGLLGPGAHSVQLEAEPGEEVSVTAPALNGWTIKVTLDGEEIQVPDASPNLETGANMVYICREGNITPGLMGNGAGNLPSALGQDAQITIVNECEAAVNVSYKIGNAIPWPVFGLFAS